MSEEIKCPCGGDIIDFDGYTMRTLVGYSSPPGHDHDDNCLTRAYKCSEGHVFALSKRRRCSAIKPDGTRCTWVGKEECFCHPGKKIDEWPVVQWPAAKG